jgi:deoxyribose-phosphate aldolase
MIDRELVREITDAIWARIRQSELLDCPGPDECFLKQPDDLRRALQLGAERFGARPEPPHSAGEMAQYIDHTLLKPEATLDQIRKLCDEALKYGFASVCVNPVWIGEVAHRLRGSNSKACSVVGFPLGAATGDVKAYEARRAIFDGAREIDMVINIGALKSGLDDIVQQDIRAVVQACHQHDAICKVIIETALLETEEKVKACVLAKEAQADFVKTSTGFSKAGATIEDVALMRRVVGPELGVKAAGGIKSYEDAQKMIEAGATRIGASVGVKIVQAITGSGGGDGRY